QISTVNNPTSVVNGYPKKSSTLVASVYTESSSLKNPCERSRKPTSSKNQAPRPQPSYAFQRSLAARVQKILQSMCAVSRRSSTPAKATTTVSHCHSVFLLSKTR